MIVEICWNVGNLDEFTQLQLWMGFMDFIWFYGLSVSVNRAHKRIYNILLGMATLQPPCRNRWVDETPPKKAGFFASRLMWTKTTKWGRRWQGWIGLGLKRFNYLLVISGLSGNIWLHEFCWKIPHSEITATFTLWLFNSLLLVMVHL
jgi:hypothetical protein